jgi:hypothetical protein
MYCHKSVHAQQQVFWLYIVYNGGKTSRSAQGRSHSTHIKAHKETLSTHVFNKDHISEEDKHWLDNEANLVDEDVVVD